MKYTTGESFDFLRDYPLHFEQKEVVHTLKEVLHWKVPFKYLLIAPTLIYLNYLNRIMAFNSKIVNRISVLPITTPMSEKYKCIDFDKRIDGMMLLNYSFSNEFSFNYCKFRYHISK